MNVGFVSLGCSKNLIDTEVMIGKFKNNQYIICGDNCWQLEYVNPEQIKGIVTEYCRNGKWHSTDYLFYKISQCHQNKYRHNCIKG